MTGEWNALSQEQEEIIALKANLATLKGASKPNRHLQSSTSNQNKKQQWSERPKVNEKAKGKTHQKQLTGKHHWRNTKPLPHEPTTKTVDGSRWHYCTHHQAWGRHTTDECIKKPFTTVSNQTTATASMAHIGIHDIQVCDNEFSASALMAQLTNHTHHSGTQLYNKAHKKFLLL